MASENRRAGLNTWKNTLNLAFRSRIYFTTSKRFLLLKDSKPPQQGENKSSPWDEEHEKARPPFFFFFSRELPLAPPEWFLPRESTPGSVQLTPGPDLGAGAHSWQPSTRGHILSCPDYDLQQILCQAGPGSQQKSLSWGLRIWSSETLLTQLSPTFYTN